MTPKGQWLNGGNRWERKVFWLETMREVHAWMEKEWRDWAIRGDPDRERRGEEAARNRRRWWMDSGLEPFEMSFLWLFGEGRVSNSSHERESDRDGGRVVARGVQGGRERREEVRMWIWKDWGGEDREEREESHIIVDGMWWTHEENVCVWNGVGERGRNVVLSLTDNYCCNRVESGDTQVVVSTLSRVKWFFESFPS